MGSSYFPDAYGGGRLDFSGIESLGDSIGGAITSRMDQNRIKSAWQEAGGDYNEAVKRLLAAGDVKGAAAINSIATNNNDKFFGTPIWGVDSETGKEGVGAFTKNGRFEALDTGGFQPTRGVTMENLGTSIAPANKTTGAPAGSPMPIDIVGRESAEKQGAIVGERDPSLTRLQDLEANLDELKGYASQLIDLSDPQNPKPTEGLKRISGSYAGPIPSNVVPNYPGGKAADAEATLDTLKTKVGFNALAAMREASKTGGALGQIAIQEGVWLQNSLESLKTEQNPETLAKRVKAIMDWTERTKLRARGSFARTYGQTPQVAPATQPNELPVQNEPLTGPQGAPMDQPLAPGMVVGGFRFRGGNPNDPNAWEQAQ